MPKQCAVWFIRAAGALLVATGLAKALSSFGTGRILALEDPITGVAFRKLLPVVGVVEVLVALACFSRRRESRLKLRLVAWMATNFLVYRLGLWATGWHHPCGCMGNLAGALHLPDRAADNIMKGVLTFLLVGSYLLLYLDWRARRAAGPPASPPPEPTGPVPG